MPQHLLQYHPRIQRNLLILVPRQRSKYHIRLPTQVLDRRPSRADLAPEKVIEDLDDVFAGFELEAVDVKEEGVEEVGLVCFLCELCDELGDGFCDDSVNE